MFRIRKGLDGVNEEKVFAVTGGSVTGETPIEERESVTEAERRMRGNVFTQRVVVIRKVLSEREVEADSIITFKMGERTWEGG